MMIYSPENIEVMKMVFKYSKLSEPSSNSATNIKSSTAPKFNLAQLFGVEIQEKIYKAQLKNLSKSFTKMHPDL